MVQDTRPTRETAHAVIARNARRARIARIALPVACAASALFTVIACIVVAADHANLLWFWVIAATIAALNFSMGQAWAVNEAKLLMYEHTALRNSSL